MTKDEQSVTDNHENILKNMANKRENVAKLQSEFSQVDQSIQEESGNLTEMTKAMKILQEQIEELQAENLRLEQDQKIKHSKVGAFRKKSSRNRAYFVLLDLIKSDCSLRLGVSVRGYVRLSIGWLISQWAIYANFEFP